MHESMRGAGQLSIALLAAFTSSSLWAQPGAVDSLEMAPSVATVAPSPVFDAEHVSYAYAQVLNVSPVLQDVRVPQSVEQCDEYERIERPPPRRSGGTVLGAIIGGALGNQVGSGSGRAAATIAGAVVGGAIGREAGSEAGVSNETRCHTVEEYTLEPQVVGYDVEYRYRGEVFVSRLDYNPGDRLRIRVAVTPAEASSGPPQDEAPMDSRGVSYY